MRLCAIVCECVCVLCCVVMLFKRLCLLPLSVYGLSARPLRTSSTAQSQTAIRPGRKLNERRWHDQTRRTTEDHQDNDPFLHQDAKQSNTQTLWESDPTNC